MSFVLRLLLLLPQYVIFVCCWCMGLAFCWMALLTAASIKARTEDDTVLRLSIVSVFEDIFVNEPIKLLTLSMLSFLGIDFVTTDLLYFLGDTM